MVRSIGSVVGGFILWTVLWLGSNSVISLSFPDSFNPDGSTDSVGILVLLLILSVVFSVLAGYVAARLAPRHATKHAWILGGVLFAVGLFVQIQFWDVMPLWYHLGFLALLIPAARYGANLVRP